MNTNSRERKHSYMAAVADDKTEKRAELLSFEKRVSPNSSSEDKVNSNSENAPGTPTETFVVGTDVEQEYKETPADPREQSWREFSENTTLHGFRFIFVRWSPWTRLIWVFLLLTCSSYVVYSLFNSIIKYLDYPIATIIKIEHPEDSMPFPAVTLCPMTAVTKFKASMRDDQPLFNRLGLNIDACEITAAVRAGRPCGEALLCCCSNNDYINVSEAVDDCTEDYRKELINVLNAKKEAFNEREFFKAYGPSIGRMIIPRTCYFGSLAKHCSYEDFDPIMTDYRVCYSFNSAADEKKVLKVSYGDVSSGLFVMLNLRVDDHMFGLFSEGLRVLVHNQGEHINLWNGVLVAPGTHAQISVIRKVYHNKKKPYETQCDSRRLASFPTYTSDGCYYECISNKTFETCKCRVIGDTGNIADRVCFREDADCTHGVVHDLFEGTKNCDCPLACDGVSYEPTISTASFPNPSMIRILKRSGYNRTEEYFRKNFIFLQVGYKAFSYEYLRQKSQYDSGALMGEIGGNMGLFLGCSILTICEFVNFVIYLCYRRNMRRS